MKTLVVANWKMNPQTLHGAKKLFNFVKREARNIKKTEVVICPPFVFLSNIQCLTPNIKLGAQDVFWEKEGAYTGEVSSSMLNDTGCQYLIIGHSERRRYFKETDEIINKKLKAALAAKLNPIFCIGETQEQRNRGETDRILRKQIEKALKDISKFKIQNSKFCIAYEPIWAIGTGRPCDVEEAQKMGLLIRKIISKIYNQTVSKNVRILYGGSVNSKNAAEYIKEAGLQGLLVGGASLDAKEFVDLIKKIC
jgi:triosephosphate isomerase